MFATTSQLILVKKSLAVADLRELLAWIRANPGKVTDGGAHTARSRIPRRSTSSS